MTNVVSQKLLQNSEFKSDDNSTPGGPQQQCDNDNNNNDKVLELVSDDSNEPYQE